MAGGRSGVFWIGNAREGSLAQSRPACMHVAVVGHWCAVGARAHPRRLYVSPLHSSCVSAWLHVGQIMTKCWTMDA
eukprot:4893657-Pleurochrysis_carterae.AAC.1